MQVAKLLTAAATTAALMAAPAWALPSQVPSNSGTSNIPSGVPYTGTTNPGSANIPAGAPYSGTTNPGSSHIPAGVGPNASLPAQAKAYGKFCQGQSKRHVAGQHGTPFSNCVTAMAKLNSGSATNPTSACKTESKKHVAGQHGTPFSLCVSGAAQLLGSTHTS